MTDAGDGPQPVPWSGNPRKAVRREKLVRRLPPLLTALIRVIHATLRYRLHVSPAARRLFRSGSPFVLGFWHGRMVILSQIFRMQFRSGEGLWVLISHHWDGEIIARTVRPFGVHGIRGSSTRGGREGYAAMLERLRAGDRVAITPDGPKGPRFRVVQTGIVRLARESGVPVVPVSWSARPRVCLRSWDRFQIPLPGARVHAFYGDPIPLSTGEPIEVQRRRVETRLNLLSHETAARVREARAWTCWAAGYRMARGLVSLLRPRGVHRQRGAERGCDAMEGAGPSGTAQDLLKEGSAPVWLHVDSAAGMTQAIPLVQRFRAEGAGRVLWVSGASSCGSPMVRKAREEGVPLVSFPGGRPWCGKTVRRVRPRIFVLVGTRVRPDLLLLLGRAGLPVALVNGRVSDEECARALWFRSFYRGVLDNAAVFGMETRRDALRIIRMGADPRRVHVTGGGPCGWGAGRNFHLLEPWLDHE